MRFYLFTSFSRPRFASHFRKIPQPLIDPKKIRNVAIIAHVDHGKTTLVDQVLKQSGMGLRVSQRLLDHNALESERGITILSKVTRINYKGHVLNIVDTPGHADFGGEVERILSMVDGAVLVVDAIEGPRTQTKFVLQKALVDPKLVPIVVVNKIDRPGQIQDGAVDSDIFDLFVNLDATDAQLEYPTLYGSGKLGFVAESLPEARSILEASQPSISGGKNNNNSDAIEIQDGSTLGKGLAPLFDLILEKVPPPEIIENEVTRADERNLGFSMMISQLDILPKLGHTVTGKVLSGWLTKGDRLYSKNLKGEIVGDGKVRDISITKGIDRESIVVCGPGDVVSVSVDFAPKPSETLVSLQSLPPVKSRPIDPPILEINLSVNDSPFAGRDGKYITPLALGERLMKEALVNVALDVVPSPQRDSFRVLGRGELQMGILFESMRREGYEFSLSSPQTTVTEVNGVKYEPWEDVQISVPPHLSNEIIDKLSQRDGEFLAMETGKLTTELRFHISSANFMGMRTAIRDLSAGTAAITSELLESRPLKPRVKTDRLPVMIANTTCTACAVDVGKAQRNGRVFVTPTTEVYEGMILGEITKGDLDIDMNLSKSEKDQYAKAAPLTNYKQMTLEEMLNFIENDEKLEVTPKRLATRKIILNTKERIHARNAQRKAGL